MTRSNRLANLPSYPFARWAAHVRAAREQGLDVIRMDIGNPDMSPADEVVEALCRSARQPDHHGYPGYRGIPALREAVAEYYGRRFGVELDPDTQVVPLIGSKEGIVNMALACLDPGDLALVPDAIVLDGVGLLQGFLRSASVVWRNLWPTLGIALLSYVIGAGFTLIWDRVAVTAWGTAVGILGTAYIGAAISAAGLAFYADRRRRWQETTATRVA